MFKQILAALILLALCLPAAADKTGGGVWIGGCGGAYFLAEPGEPVVEVYKRDRNARGRHTDLRANLVGPDRAVLQEATIPDDGRPRSSGLGPVGTARLSARVERKGVYGLNVTVSQDRYGQEILWGLRTNCPHYLIETSRGHKDERHQEPTVLGGSDRPADVCFLPRQGPPAMEVTDLPEGVGDLSVFDAAGGNSDATDTPSNLRPRSRGFVLPVAAMPLKGQNKGGAFRLRRPRHKCLG